VAHLLLECRDLRAVLEGLLAQRRELVVIDPEPHVVDREPEQRRGEDSGADRGALEQHLPQLEAADRRGLVRDDDQREGIHHAPLAGSVTATASLPSCTSSPLRRTAFCSRFPFTRVPLVLPRSWTKKFAPS